MTDVMPRGTAMSDSDLELTFPPLVEPPPEPWHWPAPPFTKWPADEAELVSREPCRVETASGTEVQGELHGFDPEAGCIGLTASADGTAVTLPFDRFTRLTLTRPCRLLDPDTREPLLRLPMAAWECEYHLQRAAPLGELPGRTLGHVPRPEGLYLYAGCAEQRAVLRVFVPRRAYLSASFGPTVQDIAAERWVATPRQLLQALEQQRHAKVVPIGQAMLELGLVTPEQIHRAQAAPLGEMPLGERLVAIGAISKADLHTGLAHKMGYPVVDLTRFPIEPKAVKKLSLRTAQVSRCVPLLLDGKRLIVAVDRPARLEYLRGHSSLHGFQVLAAIAPKLQIKLALATLSQSGDLWSDASGSTRLSLFPTTT